MSCLSLHVTDFYVYILSSFVILWVQNGNNVVRWWIFYWIWWKSELSSFSKYQNLVARLNKSYLSYLVFTIELKYNGMQLVYKVSTNRERSHVHFVVSKLFFFHCTETSILTFPSTLQQSHGMWALTIQPSSIKGSSQRR